MLIALSVQVPLLDLKAQLLPIREEVHRAVLEVIDSTRYVMGPKIEELEVRIAAYAGAKHAIGVSSGTDALLATLMALDVGPGDVVLTSPYSFIASAACAARLGALPAFADIDPNSYNLDPEQLRRFFETDPLAERVKAIVPVHLFGQCADMLPILEIARERGIPVVEDAAQALGARYPKLGKIAGTMGTIGCYSFFPSKNLGAAGDGGMIVTNDDELAEKLRVLRLQGSKPKYHNAIIGGNFRLDPIQAAVLLVKLEHLEAWHQGRRRNAAYYDERIRSSSITKPAAVWGRDAHVYNQYVISVAERRDELVAFLQTEGVGCEIYYPLPFHLQKCFAYLDHRAGSFPVSEQAAQHTLALPIYPELTVEMQDYVVSRLEAFFQP